MPWKIENDVVAMDEHKNPIWVHDDGKEVGWNAGAQLQSIKELVEAKKRYKEERDTFENQLKGLNETFGDYLKDPERIKTALSTLSDVEAGKMIAEGKKSEAIAKALADAEKEHSARLASVTNSLKQHEQKLTQKDEIIFNLMVNSAFGQSSFLSSKTSMPSDIAALVFGRNFKVEEIDGELKTVAYKDGEKMYSLKPERAGKLADFEESIERLFNEYSGKERFFKDLPGGPRAAGGHGSPNGKDIILKGSDAKDPLKYRQAKDMAMKQGGQVILEK